VSARAARLALVAACVLVCPARAANLEVIATTGAGTPLADVVVVLDGESAPPATPPHGAIDQVDKQFVPRVSVLRTGTVVRFPNSDRIRHHVYSFSPAKTFNLKLYSGREAPPVVFDRPGLVVLGCNIHDQMIAFVAVVDSPWFGRTGPDGRATLAVPPGRYRLRVWHPDLAAPVATREFVVAGASQSLPLSLSVAPGGRVAEFPP
jgi:plastocyanin